MSVERLSPPAVAPVSLHTAAKRFGFARKVYDSMLRSPFNALATVVLAWLLFMLLPPVVEWLLIEANFSAPNGQACRQQSGGACWAFIADKYRLILFGTYPYDDQWRPLAATALMLGAIVISAAKRFRGWGVLFTWAAVLPAAAILMAGGIFGLKPVENVRWGGLPLTLMLSTFGIAFAFPLGIVLALGRRSQGLPVIRALCVGYIELIRGVPLISVLFMSSVMLPLFLPEGVSIDKLLRAQIAIILFAAAYIAEIVRGGLQSIPRGQFEGAASLGLTYWQQTRKIILPQALKVVVPPLVSTSIALFKDTSLVVIIGIYDLTQSAKAALADPLWGGFAVEAYLFIGLIYFVFCYSISRYSRVLERELSRERSNS